MVLVCVCLDGRVKIVNKVKSKFVRYQRSVIMWIVFVRVRGGGKVTFYQVPKCNNVNFSYMYQPLVENLSIM